MAEQGSPQWWLERLNKALDERAKKVREAEAWFCGDHPVPDPPANTFPAEDREGRLAFEKLSKLGVTNFLGTVASKPASKLRVDGFRFGEGSQATDQLAWNIWQRNYLDADSGLNHETALRTGQSFALVWADADGRAVITLEDPGQAIVAYAPGSRRLRLAGLKRWVDDEGYILATLYLPDAIYKFRSANKALTATGIVIPTGVNINGPVQWDRREVASEAWPLRNPLGLVPLVEYPVNTDLKARPFGGGVPEFARQITDQRRINQKVVHQLVTMEAQAFRQRWVVGWKPPVDKATGEVDRGAVLRGGASRLVTFEGNRDEIEVGEFAQADFNPIVQAIEMDVKAIASSSATPPYAFLLGDMINVAAESLARIEGDYTAKLEKHARELGERDEETIRLALMVEGETLARDDSSSVLWAEFEQRTATEQVALAQAYSDLGAPKEAVFAQLPGVDQQEARRWVAQLAGTDPAATAGVA